MSAAPDPSLIARRRLEDRRVASELGLDENEPDGSAEDTTTDDAIDAPGPDFNSWFREATSNGSDSEPIRGFGAIGLGQIIGEAGNLSDYANPAKLWKRMGLGLVDGGRQRKMTDKATAERHGYSPRRRSVMFVIGDSLLKSQNAYKALYDERKAYEIARAEAAGLIVVPAAKIKKGTEAAHFSHGHAHNRARRYVEKRLLRDLWRAWRGEALE